MGAPQLPEQRGKKKEMKMEMMAECDDMMDDL